MNWDYSPSRELTAIVYVAFEYLLLLYIVFEFAMNALSYKKGLVSSSFWTFAKIAFPFEVIFVALFRMIFIVLAYTDVRGHTAGFLGLQIMLTLNSIINVWYILDTGVYYRWLGGLEGTRIAFYIYLYCNYAIMAIKLYLTAFVVFSFGGPDVIYPAWAKQEFIFGKVVGEIIDLVWMFFYAIMPLIVSYIRKDTEPKIFVNLKMENVPSFSTE